MKKSIIIISGIILFSIMIWTRQKGLSPDTIELYEEAINLSSYVNINLWNGFDINNYPIAIRDKEREYVFGNFETFDRDPYLGHLACTAQPVDGIYNIFILSKEEMDVLGGLIEGADDEQYILRQFGTQTDSITDAAYIGLLYHEGFHAYQFSNYEDTLDEWLDMNNDTDNAYQMMDRPDIVQLYKNEGAILYEIFQTDDHEILLNIANTYVENRETRHDYLTDELNSDDYLAYTTIENYYEVIEGIAEYINAKVYEHIENPKDTIKYYDKLINDDKIGYRKFYESGMAICVLLDKLDIEWKTKVFERMKTPYDILKKYTEAL